MKQEVDEKSQKSSKLRSDGKFQKYILIAGMLSLMIMLMTVVGSMFYFSVQVKENVKDLSGQKYQNYDAYYVVITEDAKTDFWQSVLEGAQGQANKNNAYVEILGSQLSDEYNKYQLMQIAIFSKADGIIVQAGEDARMTQLIQRAEQEGIPVVTVLEDNSAGGRQSFISVSSHNLGLEYGKQIAEIIEQKQQQFQLTLKEDGTYELDDDEKKIDVVVLLNGNVTDNSQNTVLTAMNEMLDQRHMSGLVQIDTQMIHPESAFSPEEAIRDIFVAREIKPDIIVCLSEQNTVRAYQAVVDHNRVGQTEILGYYESDTIKSAIEKKIIWSSITIDTKQMGAFCIDALSEFRESGYVSDYYAVDISLLQGDSLLSGQIGGADEETP